MMEHGVDIRRPTDGYARVAVTIYDENGKKVDDTEGIGIVAVMVLDAEGKSAGELLAGTFNSKIAASTIISLRDVTATLAREYPMGAMLAALSMEEEREE